MSDLLTWCLDFPHQILPSLSEMQLVQRVLHCFASSITAGDEPIAQAALSFVGTYSLCFGSLPWHEKAMSFPSQGMACEHTGLTHLIQSALHWYFKSKAELCLLVERPMSRLGK